MKMVEYRRGKKGAGTVARRGGSQRTPERMRAVEKDLRRTGCGTYLELTKNDSVKTETFADRQR